VVVDALSRIHHPVSATPAATIIINTVQLQIISAEEWKQVVCELLVEDAYFDPIVNFLQEEAAVTNDIRNNSSFRQKHPGDPDGSDSSDRTSYHLTEN